jgi:hypothetical protein
MLHIHLIPAKTENSRHILGLPRRLPELGPLQLRDDQVLDSGN